WRDGGGVRYARAKRGLRRGRLLRFGGRQDAVLVDVEIVEKSVDELRPGLAMRFAVDPKMKADQDRLFWRQVNDILDIAGDGWCSGDHWAHSQGGPDDEKQRARHHGSSSLPNGDGAYCTSSERNK